MSRCHLASIWALLFSLLFAPAAQAFFDPPWVTPENPIAGEIVSVNIRRGLCDAILEREGYPRITRDDGAIRLIEYGVHNSPEDFCIYPIATLARPLGVFSAGDYTLTVDLAYEHPVFGPTILNIGTVSFSVAELPEAVSVPAIGRIGEVALLLLLFAIAGRELLKRHSMLALLILLGLSPDIRAQETQAIEIVLSQSPGAPTPEQMVAWANSAPRSP